MRSAATETHYGSSRHDRFRYRASSDANAASQAILDTITPVPAPPTWVVAALPALRHQFAQSLSTAPRSWGLNTVYEAIQPVNPHDLSRVDDALDVYRTIMDDPSHPLRLFGNLFRLWLGNHYDQRIVLPPNYEPRNGKTDSGISWSIDAYGRVFLGGSPAGPLTGSDFIPTINLGNTDTEALRVCQLNELKRISPPVVLPSGLDDDSYRPPRGYVKNHAQLAGSFFDALCATVTAPLSIGNYRNDPYDLKHSADDTTYFYTNNPCYPTCRIARDRLSGKGLYLDAWAEVPVGFALKRLLSMRAIDRVSVGMFDAPGSNGKYWDTEIPAIEINGKVIYPDQKRCNIGQLLQHVAGVAQEAFWQRYSLVEMSALTTAKDLITVLGGDRCDRELQVGISLTYAAWAITAKRYIMDLNTSINTAIIQADRPFLNAAT